MSAAVPGGGAITITATITGTPASAQQPAAAPQQPAADLWHRDYLLGFGPRRKVWEQHGFQIDLFYNAFFGWNAKGGVRRAEDYSHSFDLFVRADSERLGLWSGGTALLHVKNNYGENINPDVGALSQVIDDADFTEDIYVDQLYYEHHMADNTLAIRAGYLDYQTIIDRNAYANSEDVQFMNAALDNNPLVPLKIGFGAALYADPVDWLGIVVGTSDAENKIRSAGFDTAFRDGDGLMAYGEVTVRSAFDSARGVLPGNYRLGVYYDPRQAPVYAEMRNTAGTLGTWLSFDQLVYREQDADRQGLGLFLRWAWRQEESYSISQFWSGGLQYLGLLPGRELDAFGLGFFDMVSSDDYEANVDPDFGGETGVEAYYRIQCTPWLAVTPDVQYIADPGGRSSDRDALVFVLRARVRF